MNEKKKYYVFDLPLHEVTTESIRLSENNRKIYINNLEELLDRIINQMKTDETFKCLYKTWGYTGSSYENLKVRKSNEFDINLIFAWPANACEVLYDSKQPGYVKLKVHLENPALKKLRGDAPNFDKKLNKWTDRNGFFLRKIFKSWMQGMLAKAIDTVSNKDTEIKPSASGPAITLKIQQNSEQLKYSVDLVPAFLFSDKDWPILPVRQLPRDMECKEWSVVPNEPKSENEPVYWQMTFHTQEKELMNGRDTMKHVIKLMKLLRDKENWSNDLYSYAIKTIFLWECENSDIDFWKKGLGTLFVYMLQKLSDDYLRSGKILCYWDEKLNLIEKMKEITRQNVRDRICAILKIIDSSTENPYAIKACFGCVPEKMPQSSDDVTCNSSVSLIDLNDDFDSSLSTSSYVVTPPQTQNLLESETKPEIEKMNEDVLCAVDYNKKCISDTRVDTDSPSAIELLKTILKEQQKMNEMLQSMRLQFSELSTEVRVLLKENRHLREQLQGGKKESNSKTSDSIEDLLSFKCLSISHSSDNKKCNSDKSQASPIQQNSSTVPNVFASEKPLLNNDKDLQFSQLLPSDFGIQKQTLGKNVCD